MVGSQLGSSFPSVSVCLVHGFVQTVDALDWLGGGFAAATRRWWHRAHGTEDSASSPGSQGYESKSGDVRQLSQTLPVDMEHGMRRGVPWPPNQALQERISLSRRITSLQQ
ncbi:hypothetical protein F1559_001646 [Cyanidiococcus yangmingshanensis]|uniref:Uncharacterized protein n=1 Tax=Cyanidiococcus yangmingshanensis TaxID=2690220 RepID=A0A7J7IKP8_9RHOD|nr:hypothetical protein F1559_001646 [Cyanidiococcus yangmingshanensis]